jgi:acyl-coenzyme A thioesterase PaaI-like protein
VSAEALVVERTRRVGVLEAKVRVDGQRLVAVATGSFFISGRD